MIMTTQPNQQRASVLSCLAVLAMLVPGPAWSWTDGSVAVAKKAAKQAGRSDSSATVLKSSAQVVDVRLGSDGSVVGWIRGERGRELSAATVVFSTAGKVVAQARADHRGEYRVVGLSGGVYHVQVGETDVIARLWTSASAPPQSQQRLDLDTTRRPVLEVRGQDGEVVETSGLDPVHRFGLDGVGGLDSFELAMMATSIVSLTLAAVMLTKMAELQDTVDRLPASN